MTSKNRELWILVAFVIIAVHIVLGAEVVAIIYMVLYSAIAGFFLPARFIRGTINETEWAPFCSNCGLVELLFGGSALVLVWLLIGFAALCIHAAIFGLGFAGYIHETPGEATEFVLGGPDGVSMVPLVLFIYLPMSTTSLSLIICFVLSGERSEERLGTILRILFLFCSGGFLISAAWGYSIVPVVSFLAAIGFALLLALVKVRENRNGEKQDS